MDVAAEPADGLLGAGEAAGLGVALDGGDLLPAVLAAVGAIGQPAVVVLEEVRLHHVEPQRPVAAVDLEAQVILGAGGDLADGDGAEGAVGLAEGHGGGVLDIDGNHLAGLGRGWDGGGPRCGSGRGRRRTAR